MTEKKKKKTNVTRRDVSKRKKPLLSTWKIIFNPRVCKAPDTVSIKFIKKNVMI